MPLRISHLIPCTEAEGPHRRVALWVTGCSIRCPGCCNPELFDADAGQPMEIAALVERIEHAASLHGVEGVTLVGGEPLEQLDGVTALCTALRERLPALGILIFTGMQLHAHPDPDALRVLLDLVDTVVEGPFEASRARESTTKFVGSSNQRLVHCTDRYDDPALWSGPHVAEVHVHPGGVLRVCGHPTPARRLLRALRRPASTTAPRID